MLNSTEPRWKRRVGIVGIGIAPHRTRRPDVNQVELINEAVREAFNDAQLTPKDIDCNVQGNMPGFEGCCQTDMWHCEGYGGYLVPGIRVTAGGTTGGAVLDAAVQLCASGVYDVVLGIAWEKQDEIEQTTTGIVNIQDGTWGKWISAGAIGSSHCFDILNECGPEVEMTIAKRRVQISETASLNPKAHLRQKLTVEEVMNSPYLVYPLRRWHMCPQSVGACCTIVACEEKAKKIAKNPVWVKDYVRVSVPSYGESRQTGKPMHQSAAERLFKRCKITDPMKDLDLFECYDPDVWRQLQYCSWFLFKSYKETAEFFDKGVFARDGAFPVNPSGGTLSSNAIGCTSMMRPAEAALQVRGNAGPHQVTKEVKTAMASCFGGGGTILYMLSKTLD